MPEAPDAKLPLPSFLKVLTNNNVPATKAMAIAGKIYKQYNTPAALSELNDYKLKAAGLEDKEDRKLTLSAVRKAGYKPAPFTPKRSGPTRNTTRDAGPSTLSQPAASVSPSAAQTSTSGASPRKKRKRDEGHNEFLPDRPSEEREEQALGSLDFNEVLDEEVLRTKHTVVNRAPIMMAWAFVVAERLGFQREEALSIASVYTEMNAISKGVSLGLYDEKKKAGVEASRSGAQPYVDLMGRRPLYQTANSTWRALASGSPVAPASAYSYITRSLKQTAPNIVGALRLLADSYAPNDLNRRGYSLYADFRPEVSGWGGRGEVRCEKILRLRNRNPPAKSDAEEARVKVEDVVKTEGGLDSVQTEANEEPAPKKARGMTLEEYEAALDDDDIFAQVDLDFRDPPKQEDA